MSSPRRRILTAARRVTEPTAPTQPPYDLIDPRIPEHREADIYHWTPQVTDYEDPYQLNYFGFGFLADINTENPVVLEAFKALGKDDPELAVLLAVEAFLAGDPDAEEARTLEARRALRNAQYGHRKLRVAYCRQRQIRLGPLNSVAALSASTTVHSQTAGQPNDQFVE